MLATCPSGIDTFLYSQFQHISLHFCVLNTWDSFRNLAPLSRLCWVLMIVLEMVEVSWRSVVEDC